LDQEFSKFKKENRAITFKAFNSLVKLEKKAKNKWPGAGEDISYLGIRIS